MKKKIILFSSSFILLGFSIFSFFYFTSKQNVSIEYKMYYIDHELNYYLEDNGFKNHYSVGTTCEYKVSGNYRNQGSGWSKVHQQSTKTTSKISNIYFYINNEANDLNFNFKLAKTEQTSVTICVNNYKTDYTFDISTKLNHSCTLPNSLFKKNAVNKISLQNSSDTYFNVSKVSLL